MSSPITRRTFIRRAAGAAIAPVAFGQELPGLASQLARAAMAPARGAPKRVVVLGGGLAGLSAAYELMRLGHDVTVLEARMRPGGRIETLRDGFADGLYVEAGGTRIPDVHHWTMKYIEAFRLPLVPFRPSGLADVYHLRGRRIVAGDSIAWPYALDAREMELGPAGLRREHLEPVWRAAGDPLAPGWPPPDIASYDRMSTAELLRSRGISREGIALLTSLGLGAPDPQRISALFTIRNRAVVDRARQWGRIEGGNDRLPRAFAAALGSRVRFGAAVEAVEQTERGAAVRFRRGGTRESLACDRVVCALPLPMLERVAFTPRLSAAKRDAVVDVPRSAATKVFVQMRRRFWLDQGLSGFATTDLPIDDVWDLTVGQAGERGVLTVYTAGPEAVRLGAMSEGERVATALRHLEQVFPGATEHCEGTASKVWHRDPWQRSAFAAFAPGQITRFAQVVATPEGRIHFAGDHASSATGWMHGALESGNRAAREVHAAGG